MATLGLSEAAFGSVGLVIDEDIDLTQISTEFSDILGFSYDFDSLDLTKVTRSGISATGNTALAGTLTLGAANIFGNVGDGSSITGFNHILFTDSSLTNGVPAGGDGGFEVWASDLGDLYLSFTYELGESFLDVDNGTVQLTGDLPWFDFQDVAQGIAFSGYDLELDGLQTALSVTGTDFADSIDGGAGDDLLEGLAGADYISGWSGIDEISGGAGNDELWGDDGDDILTGDSGADELHGGSGNDTLSGGAGNDYLSGGEDDDVLEGDGGIDDIYGGAGADVLSGGTGDDYLSGDDGDDELDGGAGDDELYGGFGSDILVGGTEDDYLSANEGDDELYGDDGEDDLYGGTGNDMLYGGAGNDHLYGYDDDDELYGEEGNDSIAGDFGDDKLFGGAGNDRLYADIGKDLLQGDAGRDRFTFNTANEHTDTDGDPIDGLISPTDDPTEQDVVVDFDHSEDLFVIAEPVLNAGVTEFGNTTVYITNDGSTVRYEEIGGYESDSTVVDQSGQVTDGNFLFRVQQYDGEEFKDLDKTYYQATSAYDMEYDPAEHDGSYEVDFSGAPVSSSSGEEYDVFYRATIDRPDDGGITTGQDKFDLRFYEDQYAPGDVEIQDILFTQVDFDFSANDLLFDEDPDTNTIDNFFLEPGDGTARAVHVEYLPSDGESEDSLMVYFDADQNGDFSVDSDLFFAIYNPLRGDGTSYDGDLTSLDLYNDAAGDGSGTGIFIFNADQLNFWYT